MGSVQRIDTGSFADVLSKIDSARSAFSASKDNIISATDSLLGTWTGRGKDAFADAYRILKVELEDEEENLQVIYDDLKGIKASYEEWDTNTSTTSVVYGADVYLARITAAIVGVTGVVNATNVQLNGGTADLTLTENGTTQQVPVMGTVTLTEGGA